MTKECSPGYARPCVCACSSARAHRLPPTTVKAGALQSNLRVKIKRLYNGCRGEVLRLNFFFFLKLVTDIGWATVQKREREIQPPSPSGWAKRGLGFRILQKSIVSKAWLANKRRRPERSIESWNARNRSRTDRMIFATEHKIPVAHTKGRQQAPALPRRVGSSEQQVLYDRIR